MTWECKLEELYRRDRTRFARDFKARLVPLGPPREPGFSHVTLEMDRSKCVLYNLEVPTEHAKKLLLLGWT
jgi:hypothetical protein